MNGIMHILNKIIENEGNCSGWATKAICSVCPVSKLRKKADGTYYSCVEAIGIDDMTEEQADARYKEIASRILLDEAIDDLLKVPDGSQQ